MRGIRNVLAAAALAFVGWSMVHSARSVGAEGPAPAWRGRFPNVSLRTHDGRTVRFYDDLLRGKIVTINFMYVECEGTCPGVTSTLVDVQRMLGNRVGRDILLLSITLQPESDTPERLREYASRYGAGPGMVFLTGKPGDIDVLRHGLGFTDERNPGQDADDARRHLGILRIGNEPRDWWAACPSLSGASQICALLNSMDAPAVGTKPPLEDPEGPPRTLSLSLPDLRDFEALRADLDRIHMTRAALGWSVYEEKMLARMAQYLNLGEREGSWRAAMKRALAGSMGARRRMEAVRAERGNVREAWSRYQAEQSQAIAALDSVLDRSPRHRVFRDYGANWLFYLEGHPDHAER